MLQLQNLTSLLLVRCIDLRCAVTACKRFGESDCLICSVGLTLMMLKLSKYLYFLLSTIPVEHQAEVKQLTDNIRELEQLLRQDYRRKQVWSRYVFLWNAADHGRPLFLLIFVPLASTKGKGDFSDWKKSHCNRPSCLTACTNSFHCKGCETYLKKGNTKVQSALWTALLQWLVRYLCYCSAL